MKKNNTSYLLLTVLLGSVVILTSCFSNKIKGAEYYNETIDVSSKAICDKKGGYWYEGKCWANFEDMDDEITVSEIDDFVKKEMATSKKYHLTINNKKQDIQFFFPEEDEEVIILILVFEYNKEPMTLLSFCESKNQGKSKFKAKTLFLNGDLVNSDDDDDDIDTEAATRAKGELTVTPREGESEEFQLTGTLTNKMGDESFNIDMLVGESLAGMGYTTLEVEGDEALLNGTLGTMAYQQIKDLINNHPNVKTLVLENVPGSINDAVNMHTGRIIREAGIATVVKSDSKISSGGVDIFCAGKERIVHKGAQLGIHSWGGEGISADDLPKDHPAHQYQINYFTMCLGTPLGPDFYFHTLTSAPAGEMHWMSDEEITKWAIATEFIH